MFAKRNAGNAATVFPEVVSTYQEAQATQVFLNTEIPPSSMQPFSERAADMRTTTLAKEAFHILISNTKEIGVDLYAAILKPKDEQTVLLHGSFCDNIPNALLSLCIMTTHELASRHQAEIIARAEEARVSDG